MRALDIDKSTVGWVVGDHGWKLGEHGGFGKKTVFRTDTQALVILSAPEQRAPGGTPDTLVEAVDIYPTLLAVAAPDAEVPQGVQGQSFAHLLDDPRAAHKSAAFW